MSLRSTSLLATAVLVACVVWLLYRRALLAHGPILVPLQLGAAALMLWARVTFGARSFHAGANPTEGGLVTTGPYRWIRHPIYAAILVFVWAGVAASGSVVNVALAIVATAALGVRIGAEETLTVTAYPDYADYARRTKRIIPFVL